MTRDDLAGDPRSAELLAYHYDFDVRADLAHEPWFSIDGAAVLPTAADAAGGVFAECAFPDRRPVFVYASSEGQGGTLAAGLVEWLGILVALPHWFDLLKFSGGGSLAEMRRVEPMLVQDLTTDNPKVWQAGEQLRSMLKLPPIADPVAALHADVTAGVGSVVLRAPDGSPLERLFNRFRVEDNPGWRRGGLTRS